MKEKKEEYQEEENRQQEQAKKIRGNGFDAQVFVTTDWSNLNTEKCYHGWYLWNKGSCLCGTPGCAESLFGCVYQIFRKLAGIKGNPVNRFYEKNR